MKKFLSILLALAVGFTFTFGSAMSAFALTDAEQAVKTYTENKAATYYTMIDEAGTAYMNTLTFDADGYLTGAGATFTFDTDCEGIAQKSVIADSKDLAVTAAKTAFNSAVAAFAYTGAGAITTTAEADAALQTAYNSAVTAKITNAEILGVDGTTATKINLNKVVADQYAIDKKAAEEAIAAIDLTNYSNKSEEWNKTIDTTVIDATNFNYAYTALSGLAAGNYTAYQLVEGIVNTQATAIATASTKNVTNITAIREAANKATVGVLGHLRTATENWYVAPIPTKADLSADTTLATAKANAISLIKSEMNAKQIAINNDLQNDINNYSQYSSLSAAQKSALDAAKKAQADLPKNFAAAEEVFTANINYQKTTAAVDTYVGANTSSGIRATIAGWTKNSVYTEYTLKCKDVATVTDAVKEMKTQKDVNGKPYYDAAALDAKLAVAIEGIYTANSYPTSTAAGIIRSLSEGAEKSLVDSKIAYIDFIKNGRIAAGFKPVDSKGYEVNSAWNKSDDTWTPAYTTTGILASLTINDVYDKGQAAELDKLVADTEAAFGKASTVSELEKIFAEANDKYVAIKTTKDHDKDWTSTGALYLAYTKAKLDSELRAYADYVASKYNVTGGKYPAKVNSGTNIYNNVAVPVVYEAYTVAELEAKAAEAKTAMDGIKTIKDMNAKKAEIEAAIRALPATNAIALTDAEAIKAAYDAADAFEKLPENAGAYVIVNKTTLTNAVAALEALYAKQLNDAYTELAKDDITIADADAVAAYNAMYDEYETFLADYSATKTLGGSVTNNCFDADLLKAQVAAAKTLMIALPANPTSADKAQVEAARAAYEALSLEGKSQIVGTKAYDNLIDAEEALEINIAFGDAEAKAYVQDLAVTVRTAKVGKKVKVTVNADVQTLVDNGYTVTYKFYKSTKKGSGYKNTVNKTTNTYTNTNPVKGKNYYKVKLVVKNADGTVVATTPLTQCKYGVRTIK